jgi:hypothetical protein
MLHSDFPHSPFEILEPEIRWFPADKSLRENSMEKQINALTVYNHGYAEIKGKQRLAIVETKGCEYINQRQNEMEYLFVYVDEESFDKYQPTSFNDLMKMFQEYQE